MEQLYHFAKYFVHLINGLGYFTLFEHDVKLNDTSINLTADIVLYFCLDFQIWSIIFASIMLEFLLIC